MIASIRNLFVKLWFWFKPPKLGQVNLEIPPQSINQRDEYNTLDVIDSEWDETITAAFNPELSDQPIPDKPSRKVLNDQIRMFYKDYRKFVKVADETYSPSKNFNITSDSYFHTGD